MKLQIGKCIVLVDDCDWEILKDYKWYLAGHKNYSKYVVAPARQINEPSTVRMHRLILGAKPGELVDHKNRNTLDNRRKNLRLASNQESAANRSAFIKKKQGCFSSRFKGVFLGSNKFLWKAQVCFNYSSIHLGWFNTPEEAAKCYDAAALFLYGEYAVINFSKSKTSSIPVPKMNLLTALKIS